MLKQTTGIVLSGGKSRRMGKDKGLTLYRNKELVRYSIDLLSPFCDELIISSNKPELYKKYGLQIISDEIVGKGPLGGIYSCLKLSTTLNNLVVSCDMPHLTEEVVKRLIDYSDNCDIVVPIHSNGFFEPMAGFYSKAIIPIIESAIKNEDYKLINLFDKVRLKTIDVDSLTNGSYLFKNINHPDDLLI